MTFYIRRYIFKWMLVFAVISCFVSCSQKNWRQQEAIKKGKPLFIAMPQSLFTFENIAPELYMALVHHFKRMGYRVVGSQKESYYELSPVIHNLTSDTRRYVSPDILLFNYTLQLDVYFQLKDNNGNVIKEKRFLSSTLFSKAKNPILNGSFLEHEIKKLSHTLVPRVELFFRKTILNN